MNIRLFTSPPLPSRPPCPSPCPRRLATAANLPSLAVDHAEEDVEGSRGGCFKQFYHFAHADEGRGAPNGEGSFRCLVTTATAGGTGRPADGGDAKMQLG